MDAENAPDENKQKIYFHNISEKDDEILKEFELIEKGLEETLKVRSPNIGAAMAQSWHERSSILYANAALADSPYLREGMSERLLEIRGEFEELINAWELAREPSLIERWRTRFRDATTPSNAKGSKL